MKVTLRKANALQASIRDLIKTIPLTGVVSLTEFDNATVALQKASVALETNVSRRFKLLDALYEIREQVGIKNAESGVDALLTKASLIDKKLAELASVTDHPVQTDTTVLTGQLNKIKTQQQSYSYRDSVSTGVLTEQQHEFFATQVKNLKKEKQQINDKVLSLNVTTEIELSQDVADLLQAEGIV